MKSLDEPYPRVQIRFPKACFLVVLLSLMGARFAAAEEAATRVHFQDVAARARALAAKPFQSDDGKLPEILSKMGYDQWRDIRFKPSASLWAGQPFSVQFFHPGFLYEGPVTVHHVERDGTRPFPFSQDLFEYADHRLEGHLPDDYGFAGLRVHYPLNTPQYADELVAFLGASYFRALGRGMAYGLSARGLAIDTAESSGEEFPYFREFWIVRPVAGAKAITLYALLDSPSVAGAYEFTIVPGEETVVKVKSELFIRKPVRKLGIAPLTSMFFYGENGRKGEIKDFRPEVHDSDGLLLSGQSGEWIWHPLVNPSRLLINAFGGNTPVGFGLLQRDVQFDHYQDLEARYDRRPSVWVTPQGDWGKGHLELVQIPTENEYHDNIVAYWVPERDWAPGDSVQYAYHLSWHSPRHPRSRLGFVEATRITQERDGAMFVVDFSGEELKATLKGGTLTPDVWVSQGAKITGTQLIKNPVTDGWRLVIRVAWDNDGFMEGVLPGQDAAVEFRAFLKDGAHAVTEVWSYTYLP